MLNKSLARTEASNHPVTVSTYLNYVRQPDSGKPPADQNDFEKRNAWHDEQEHPDLDPPLLPLGGAHNAPRSQLKCFEDVHW
jgi:hypothetical protein